jgi:PBP1b-binding outer membrane lipoprotein LpoB
MAMAAVVLLAGGCSQGSADPPPVKTAPTAPTVAAAPAAAQAAKEAPLLLGDPPAARNTDQKPLPAIREPMADNGRCLVCHMNFTDERLAVAHARVQVGCTACHGQSDAHSNDEGNITPPDIIYAKSDIMETCCKCHTMEHTPPKIVCLDAILDTKAERYCTDCHGDHHMAVRMIRWDKATRKLIPRM